MVDQFSSHTLSRGQFCLCCTSTTSQCFTCLLPDIPCAFIPHLSLRVFCSSVSPVLAYFLPTSVVAIWQRPGSLGTAPDLFLLTDAVYSTPHLERSFLTVVGLLCKLRVLFYSYFA